MGFMEATFTFDVCSVLAGGSDLMGDEVVVKNPLLMIIEAKDVDEYQ